eukprot:TRINITY_DN904_c0_g1_i11.p1 TRINITY_DN904_c0_g1~~TRINITY_DN904_c0_g1_i11.p1  ORF type:complete len:200 (+),score=12.17 TRINITY_DN904_c0_g1_i11:371-970(+)
MAKYLKYDDIAAIIGPFELETGFSPMSQDSYNETLVANRVLKTGNVKQLRQAAINMAIVGFGNKRYGSYRVNDVVMDLKQLFDNCDVKYRNNPGALLKEDELTPNRLCRFFRYDVRKYIQNTGAQSYMFRKYSDHDPKFADIAFRGSEYLDGLSEEQKIWLRTTYLNLDARLSTQVTERIDRVFQAKAGLTYSAAMPTK